MGRIEKSSAYSGKSVYRSCFYFNFSFRLYYPGHVHGNKHLRFKRWQYLVIGAFGQFHSASVEPSLLPFKAVQQDKIASFSLCFTYKLSAFLFIPTTKPMGSRVLGALFGEIL